MTHYEKAVAFYRARGRRTLEFDLMVNCFAMNPNGVVFINENIFLLAEARCYGAGGQVDTWWIEFLSGDMRDAFLAMPFWLPQVAFERKGRVKVYATATLINRILRDESFQNGPSDQVLRRGRRRAHQGTAATGSDQGG